MRRAPSAEGPSLLYLDGAFMPLDQGRISVEDRGFQFGDGVYEVIRVANGRLLWLEPHLSRLDHSLAAIHLAGALREHDLRALLPELVELAQLDRGTVYLQVTRGVSHRDFDPPPGLRPTVLAYTWPRESPGAAPAAGVALWPVEDIRWARCDIKSTNLLASVLAKEAATVAGCGEALWVGEAGEVREGASSNLFCVMNEVLHTHPAGRRVLDGVTRRTVLRLAEELGHPVREEPVSLASLQGAAGEAFITSTARDVLHVTAVGGCPVGDGAPGAVTLSVAAALQEEIARLAGGETGPSRDRP